jgi:arginyl-tRNA synthetase
MDLKAVFAKILEAILDGKLYYQQVYNLIEVPKKTEFGDLAFPCFQLAKIEKKPPAKIAEEIAIRLSNPVLSKINAMGPYVNATFCSKNIGGKSLKFQMSFQPLLKNHMHPIPPAILAK